MNTPKHDFRFGPSAVPARVFALEDPEHIRCRLAMPVAAGQLWLAKGHGASQYVLVDAVESDARKIAVIPMSNDVDDATEDSLTAEATPLGMPMVAWPSLRAVIPVRLLFKPLDAFDVSTFQFLHSGKTAGRAVTVSPSAFRRYLAMCDRMDLWHSMCDDLPALQPQHEHGSETAVDPDAPDYLIALVKTLGITPTQASDVIDGGTELTDSQKSELIKAGLPLPSPQASATTTLPSDLLIEVEQPEYRSMARQFEGGKDDPREALAKSMFALMARRTGSGRASWRGLLRQERDGRKSEQS